ncbi:MAG: YdcF family protein [Comamonadaceae bacterium]|nr:MAG: YdcF family protein [Comamonadaceae bacterium]
MVLLIDALALMAMRHFHLGVVLPAVLGAGFVALALRWTRVARWRQATGRRTLLWRLSWLALALWIATVLWFCMRVQGFGVAPADAPAVQAIVVLGSGTRDGEPRPTLAARLDIAAELARLQPAALIAVCGGIDLGEQESEAEIMARYLQRRHGVAPGRLVLEKESTSTELNLSLSRPLLQARGVAADAPTALVTSDFHLMRAERIARRLGLAGVVPVGAPTPLATRYNAWLREYFAMVSSWVLGEV